VALQEAIELTEKKESEMVLCRKQLQHLPALAHKQRARLSQDLAALQRDLRHARTTKTEVEKGMHVYMYVYVCM
jgi:hypothetical protein